MLGEIDPQLQSFVDACEEPRHSASTPEEPCDKRVNEYTVWLTVRGIEKQDAIVQNPNQPLTLSEVVGAYAKLSREMITSSHEESLNALNLLQDFVALMLRYPVVPKLAMDTKECPECFFEAEITADTWKDVRRKMSCYHFTLRHEQFMCTQKDTGPAAEDTGALRIDDTGDMVRAGPCGSVFMTDEAEDSGEAGECLKPMRFLEQLESLKRCDEITKQKTLGKEIFHELKSHCHTLEELEAPRYLSTYPLRCLYQFYGSLNRSRARARVLSEQYPELSRDRLWAQAPSKN